MLQDVAGEQHKQWEKDNHKKALKKAKQLVQPMAGVRFTAFSELRVLV
jgi:hypothetical protein